MNTSMIMKRKDNVLHGANVLFSKINGQFTGAKEIIAYTMIRGDTELLDGITMLLGRIALVTLPIVLRIFLG